MSYTLKLQKGGMFRARPDFATLRRQFGGVVHMGGVDEYFAYTPEPAPPDPSGEATYMLYGAKGALGRGFYMLADCDGGYELSSPMPTTLHDLGDMFAFAEQLAKLLEVKDVVADGRSVPRAALVSLFGDLKQHNGELLKSFVLAGDGPVMTTVKLPLRLPESLCRRIENVPVENVSTFLYSYLGDKQAGDFYYMKPVFTRGEGGEVVASYTLREGEPAIIQQKPFVPYGPPPFGGAEVSRWQVTLAPRQLPPMGSLAYGDFIEKLGEGERGTFDGEHWALRGLSLRRMKELLE